MENWLNEFEHESLATPEAQDAFTSAMSKYGSVEDAVMGGYEAMKLTGRPYKLPESLDKLPDDNARAEFTGQAHKLLGIEHAENIEALADLDLRANLAEGVEPDEGLANTFKEFVVAEKIPKAIAQKVLAFHNQLAAKARGTAIAKAEADKLEAATKTNESLIAHFGSKEKVAEQSELLRRAIQNSGITPEEYEKVGDAMADSLLTKDPVMARVMLTLLAPLAREGTTEPGKGGTPAPKERTVKDDLPETAKALDW